MKHPIVIKVGGALLESTDAALVFFEQLAALKAVKPAQVQPMQVQPIVVHGGGAQVQAMLHDLGFISEKHNGMRVTPESHMPIVAGVLAGTVNKQLVAYATSKSCSPVGLSIADGNMMVCTTSDPALGHVGTPAQVNPNLIMQLLENNWLPVVSSIGTDGMGKLLNINADHGAAALASAITCPLILLSDVAAVLDENKQRIPTISPSNMQSLINDGVIKDGMKVKVESAMETAQSTGKTVTIASWKDNINQIIDGQLGTQIIAHEGPLL